MRTIFMNSENSRTLIHIGDYLTLLNLTLRKGEKSVVLSNLRIYYTWKSIKS